MLGDFDVERGRYDFPLSLALQTLKLVHGSVKLAVDSRFVPQDSVDELFSRKAVAQHLGFQLHLLFPIKSLFELLQPGSLCVNEFKHCRFAFGRVRRFAKVIGILLGHLRPSGCHLAENHESVRQAGVICSEILYQAFPGMFGYAAVFVYFGANILQDVDQLENADR